MVGWPKKMLALALVTLLHQHHSCRVEKFQVEIDIHTADGFKVAFEKREMKVPMVCLEIAPPTKCEHTMVEALGRKPNRDGRFHGIGDLT